MGENPLNRSAGHLTKVTNSYTICRVTGGIAMGVHIYDYNWDFFNEESERRYYFLGFIAADGYISNNEIEIGVNVQDAYLVEQFRDWIVPDKPIYERHKTNSVLLKISCKFMISSIKDFFRMTSNKKGQEIQFPTIPEQFVKDFIRGVVDGNGCIDTVKIKQRNDNISTYIRLRIYGNQIFLTGLNATTKQFINHNINAVQKKGKENLYYLTYQGSSGTNVLHWLYNGNSICLRRKYNKYLQVTGQDEDIV